MHSRSTSSIPYSTAMDTPYRQAGLSASMIPMLEKVSSPASLAAPPTALGIPTLKRLGSDPMRTRKMTFSMPFSRWNSRIKRVFRPNFDIEMPNLAIFGSNSSRKVFFLPNEIQTKLTRFGLVRGTRILLVRLYSPH